MKSPQTAAQLPHFIVKPWKKAHSPTTEDPKSGENEVKTTALTRVSSNGEKWGFKKMTGAVRIQLNVWMMFYFGYT